jgi:N-acyl amino acid synthase of PEP-CTERM/exosortase system
MELLNQSLSERFHQYFDVDFAHSREQKSAVFGIRYRVYCEEFRFEPGQLFPDKMERDEFDERSLHCLITHRSTGKPAGAVRLVGTEDRRGKNLLPFERNCPGSLAPDFLSKRQLQRESMCEISRLVVDRPFRRRPGEHATHLGVPNAIDFTLQEKRSFSLIAIAGFLAATALTDVSGRTDVFAMMDPSLSQLMTRAGMEFTRAGKDLDYHGQRAPYYIRTEWALEKMHPSLRELYDSIHRLIDRSYQNYHADLAAQVYSAIN